MATAHLLGQLLPLESVELGRLVLNAKRPNQDFIDPADGPEVKRKSTQNPQVNFKETRRFSKSSNLTSYLSDILSFTYEKQNDCEATLSAPRATTYDLENSGAWFNNACGQAKIREFLDQAIDDNQTVYLVVGFCTVSDGSLAKSLTSTKTKGVRFQGLLSMLPAGIASPTSAANIVDPGMRSTRDVGNDQELAYEAPGEQIFAVLYRKVKFKWLSRKIAGNMILEANNRWKSVWDWRGPENQDDEPDVVEATLTDLDDLDISDEEDNNDDGTVYHREEPPKAGNRSESVHGMPEAGVKAKKCDIETNIPREKLPDLGVTKRNVQAIRSPEVGAKQKQCQDNAGEISRRFKIEFWYGLILFVCLCGGFSIFLGGSF